MVVIKKYLLLLIALFADNLAYATSLPRGCEVIGFGFYDNYVMLNDTPNQTFYLLQNFSDQKIELERLETRKIFMSPSLLIYLDPFKWAAIAIDLQNLYLQCFSKKNEIREQIACGDVLEICKYPRAKFALSNMGSYWVATNKTQKEVIREAVRKGIYLHW